MSMPSYTAEATLYGSSKQYRQRRPTTTMHTGTSVVRPQDCGLAKRVVCGGPIAAASAACASICLISPSGNACRGCMVSHLGIFGGCIDCIPKSIPDQGGGGGGLGGGGHRECCERDLRTGRCIVFKPLDGVCP